jgi:hypothetical protein
MVILSSVVVACSSLIAGIVITSGYAASYCKTYKSANGQDGIHCSTSNGEVCTNYSPKSVVCTNGSSESSPQDNNPTNQPNSFSSPITNPSMTSSDPGTAAALSNDHAMRANN